MAPKLLLLSKEVEGDLLSAQLLLALPSHFSLISISKLFILFITVSIKTGFFDHLLIYEWFTEMGHISFCNYGLITVSVAVFYVSSRGLCVLSDRCKDGGDYVRLVYLRSD